MSKFWQLASLGLVVAQVALAAPSFRVVQLKREWEKKVEKATYSYDHGDVKANIDVTGRLYVSRFDDLNEYFNDAKEASEVVATRYCGKKFTGNLIFVPKDPDGPMPFGPRSFVFQKDYEVNQPQGLVIAHLRPGSFSLQHIQVACP